VPLGKRRIAMLAACPFPTPQGTQVAIRHLATALARAGHAVHLITYGDGDPEPSPLPFFVHRAPRIVVARRSGPSVRKLFVDALLLREAWRVCRRERCEVIHGHNIEGLFVGSILKLLCGTPLVYHAHNAMGPELPTYFSGRITRALAGLAGRALDRWLPRLADAVVVFDPDHAALHASYRVAAARLCVIPPGLDFAELGRDAMARVGPSRAAMQPPCSSSAVAAPVVTRVSPRAFGAVAAPAVTPMSPRELAAALGLPPTLLYAGNPDAYQNLGLLRRALTLVRAHDPRVRLLVASHHDAAAFARCALGPLAIDEGIHFVHCSTRQQLAIAYASAHLGVCPRTLWTGAPIKVLNYLAADLPVVACRTGALHTLDPLAGRLVDATPAAFAEGILDLLARAPALRARGSMQRALARFRIEDHVPRYEAVYARVLADVVTSAARGVVARPEKGRDKRARPRCHRP